MAKDRKRKGSKLSGSAKGEKRFFNRELSWLEFNQRVLDEAANTSNPLLERVKYLAITGSNLDEFFMVRVGSLQALRDRNSTRTDPAGMTASEQLEAIGVRVRQLISDQYSCFLKTIEPQLSDLGIRRMNSGNLSEWQASYLEDMFTNQIYSVASPLAVTGPEDFPVLPNATIACMVQLAPAAGESASRFAVINMVDALPRFVTLPSEGGYEYMLIEEVVQLFADRFFDGETIIECVPFRIARNADMSVREDAASDLLEEMEIILDARQTSDCVRLEVSDECDETTLEFLKSALEVDDSTVYQIAGPLGLSTYMQLSGLSGFDELRFSPWSPCASPQVNPAENIFDTISRRDVILYHPFESFDPVVRLLEEASRDPDVLAIKQILYRTSRSSPIVAALKRAAKAGVAVTVVVELKARFDEARNIEWAKDMERAGVQVFYGVKGLKTHAKLCIVVRKEPDGIQKYLHFGTGNYNESTAKLYTDASVMTSNHEYGADATSFFHAITGYSQPPQFLHIDAAPISLRDRIIEMIRVEIERAREGHPASIRAKLNSLVDPKIIEALYEASSAGVQIDLVIRGICCLRPGVDELSENIRVFSIVDRFLEHSRILYFHHGGDERVFISSADWMPRNLDRRIELLVSVSDERAKARLIEVLDLNVRDNVKGRRLKSDGHYAPPKVRRDQRTVHSQQQLHDQAVEAELKADRMRQTTFEAHRATGQAED